MWSASAAAKHKNSGSRLGEGKEKEKKREERGKRALAAIPQTIKAFPATPSTVWASRRQSQTTAGKSAKKRGMPPGPAHGSRTPKKSTIIRI